MADHGGALRGICRSAVGVWRARGDVCTSSGFDHAIDTTDPEGRLEPTGSGYFRTVREFLQRLVAFPIMIGLGGIVGVLTESRTAGAVTAVGGIVLVMLTIDLRENRREKRHLATLSPTEHVEYRRGRVKTSLKFAGVLAPAAVAGAVLTDSLHLYFVAIMLTAFALYAVWFLAREPTG